MATITCSIKFLDLGLLVVSVDEHNNWQILEDLSTLDPVLAGQYVRMWSDIAELDDEVANYKPNLARQYLIAGLGGQLDPEVHRILRDTYVPESVPLGGPVSY